MTRRILLCALLLAATAAAFAAGRPGFGRLALALGAPSLAAGLLDDPAARGVALFEAGRLAAADAAFQAAGRAATFNRAMSLAALGQYDLSYGYFDAVLFADATDAEARRRRDLVSAFVDPVIGEANAIDGIPATAMGEAAAGADRAMTMGEQAERVMRPRDDNRSVLADETWLTTLRDEPGTYLKLRFQSQSEQRFADGLAVPPEDTPW